MSADLVLRDAAGPMDPNSNLQIRVENTINTPVVSAVYTGDGRAIADDYTLDFTVSGSVTATVSCGSGDKNPYQDLTGKLVVADGSTEVTELIPGVTLVLDASVATGWQAKISLGDLMDTSGGTTSRLVFGVTEVGTESTARRLAVTNVGSDSAQESVIDALPGSWYEGSVEFIKSILNHSAPAREKLAVPGDYTITFQNWADGTGSNLGYKTADVLVNGSVAIATAVFDGSTVYEYGSSNGYDDSADLLKGLQLVLAQTTDDPSSASVTLHVMRGYDWVEFADDVSGSPGTYAQGPLTLTESGQISGAITAGGIAYAWVKLVMPSSAAVGPIAGARVITRGLTT